MSKRQFDITVVFENVNDPHNIAACLRSCDAVGIAEVFILSTKEKNQSKLSKKSSASASKWLTINHYSSTAECFTALRKSYSKIFATKLGISSIDLYHMNFTESLALVFGNEKDGVSEEAAALCDGNFIIPQVGMIESLNISVACAVTLYEAYRQRMTAGFYQKPNDKFETIVSEWLKK
ncbi:MAG: RNA methyltransferase [Chitinophagales bacterium]|nr:RNA methyltransferase [Chitinophagales bacterium]